MAKRKNPLKDLDAFLKQEATSFVKPEKAQPEASLATEQPGLATADEIIDAINQLAAKDSETYRNELYRIIKSSLENLDASTPEDKMLINTILYLRDKVNWKSNIKKYWESHN
ncbi:MAG: hypothetical protein ABJH05_09825 [Fulvivirga sp.]